MRCSHTLWNIGVLSTLVLAWGSLPVYRKQIRPEAASIARV